MKLKSLFLAMLVMLAGVVMAQVESGKVYRIVSSKYETVITASPITHALSCVSKGGETDYQQMWEFTLEENGKYSIMNVFSRRYLQNESRTNVQFKTGNEKVFFAIRENATYAGNYNIDASSKAGGWGLHCAGDAKVVPWSDGPDGDGISGTEWKFEEVSIDQLTKDNAYAEYASFNNVNENKAAIVKTVNALFKDNAGTVLKDEYASMDDDELLAVMEGVPADLQQAVLKVKNNAWETQARANLSEKNFRVYDYKPYSNPEQWKDILYHRPFNRINNPTGICSESDRAFLYIFVDKIPEGTTIDLAEMNGTAYFGTDTSLKEGLNIVPSAVKDGVLYIRYVCNTHTGFNPETKSGPKKLSDYPAVKIHIEGGYVNGFWSEERGHTNEDWVYMSQNMFRNETAVQAVGDHTVLNFRKKEFLQPYQYTDNWGFKVEGCPTDIETVMKYWDFWNERQRWYMGLDKYYDFFNNKQLAMSDDGGFMDAGNYRTHYNNNTLTTIVNIDRISRDGGSAWGPLHEIGHTNQYAFEIVGTSEVSNNAFANFVIFDTGTHTSRGWNMDAQIKDFENKVPYVVRGEGNYGSELFSMTRMYFQLFLYFHAAGKKPDFYPTLFEELRKDKLVGWSVRSSDEKDANGFNINSVNAVNDQLKFVEKCCSIAQMDLTEFFEAWGFFIPMKNAYVGDYGHHYVYLLQEDIDACKKRIKDANYPKKGGHLMFLEDRIRYSKRIKSELNDNVNSYRADYSDEAPVAGNFCGLYGQWEDYVDESVKAEGYYYTIVKDKVVIKLGTGAKGALGFKLYDGNDKLLSYTNRHEMNIPTGVDRSKLKVVAAQADGENAEVKPATEGPLEMQKDALKASLESAKRYIDREIFSGFESQIGRFYADSLAPLKKIYDDAVADTKNASVQGKTSLVEWAAMLDDECERLSKNRGAMINLEEGMNVTFTEGTKRKGVLLSTGSGLVTQSANSSDPANAWTLEYAGIPDVYYLKNAAGKYIRDFSIGEIIDANERTTETAQKFSFGYDEKGYVFFSTYGTERSFGQETAGAATETRVIEMSTSDTRARWRTKFIEDNSAEFYKNELNAALETARMLFTEIVNVDSIGKMNIFNENVIVLDRNLEVSAVELYNQYETVSKDIDNAKMHKDYLSALRKNIYNVQGKYIVKSPIATAGDQVMWYRLYNKESGNYLSVNSSKNTLSVVAANKLDDNALWSFAKTGVKDKFEMFNYAVDGFVYNKKRDLYANGEDGVAVTVSYDAESQAVVLYVDLDGKAYPFYENGTSVALPRTLTNISYWELELVDIEADRELADKITVIEDILEEGNYNEDFYDLNGRKVLNPTRGIYIQNGKKVLYK